MALFKNLFSKEKKETLDKGLEKSKSSFFGKLSKAVAGKSKVDDDVLDELEEILVASDVGVTTTIKIIKRIEERVAKDKYLGTDELNLILREEIAGLLSETETDSKLGFHIPEGKKPYVIMVVGVNGVGKTTTIGKLAHQFKSQGKNVVLGAADTFRAAAIDQLQVWADRTGVPIVKQQMGSDPASVAFETVQEAVKQNADVVLVDTAGRLHNKVNLMNELSKVTLVDGEAFKCQPNLPQHVAVNINSFKHTFIFHRMFRSEVEYLAALYRGNPEGDFPIKLNRNGYGYINNENLQSYSFEQQLYAEYIENKKQFLKECNIDKYILDAQNTVEKKTEQLKLMLPNLLAKKPQAVAKVLGNLKDEKINKILSVHYKQSQASKATQAAKPRSLKNRILKCFKF